jgi:hypothetical protein
MQQERAATRVRGAGAAGWLASSALHAHAGPLQPVSICCILGFATALPLSRNPAHRMVAIGVTAPSPPAASLKAHRSQTHMQQVYSSSASRPATWRCWSGSVTLLASLSRVAGRLAEHRSCLPAIGPRVQPVWAPTPSGLLAATPAATPAPCSTSAVWPPPTISLRCSPLARSPQHTCCLEPTAAAAAAVSGSAGAGLSGGGEETEKEDKREVG